MKTFCSEALDSPYVLLHNGQLLHTGDEPYFKLIIVYQLKWLKKKKEKKKEKKTVGRLYNKHPIYSKRKILD